MRESSDNEVVLDEILALLTRLPSTLARVQALAILVRGFAMREADDPVLTLLARALEQVSTLHNAELVCAQRREE